MIIQPQNESAPVTTARRPSKRRVRTMTFQEVNKLALTVLPTLLERWLPGGVTHGAEYIVRNPKRCDKKAGSFSVNIRTGKWADFATDAKGGDIISLAAYLGNIRQSEAKKGIAKMLGVKK